MRQFQCELLLQMAFNAKAVLRPEDMVDHASPALNDAHPKSCFGVIRSVVLTASSVVHVHDALQGFRRALHLYRVHHATS